MQLPDVMNMAVHMYVCVCDAYLSMHTHIQTRHAMTYLTHNRISLRVSATHRRHVLASGAVSTRRAHHLVCRSPPVAFTLHVVMLGARRRARRTAHVIGVGRSRAFPCQVPVCWA